jgi:glutamate racemase
MNRRPIGVFDSGIGGLTVVRELMRQLPHESLIYFGDTARVPYGNKSPETVRRFSREILDFLLSRDVKLVVVACNTASAHALTELQGVAEVPVEGVIEPGARAAVAASRSGRIGVIGTAGTVASGAYERAIRAAALASGRDRAGGASEVSVMAREPSGAAATASLGAGGAKNDARAGAASSGAANGKVEITARACPLFVPLVEEGWLDHPASRLIAEEYLAPLEQHRIDTLVLGCTHYPLLKPLLASVLGPGIALIDSAEQTAAAVSRELAASTLHAPTTQTGRVHFVVSDAPQQFVKVGRRFLGERVKDVEVKVMGEG